MHGYANYNFSIMPTKYETSKALKNIAIHAYLFAAQELYQSGARPSFSALKLAARSSGLYIVSTQSKNAMPDLRTVCRTKKRIKKPGFGSFDMAIFPCKLAYGFTGWSFFAIIRYRPTSAPRDRPLICNVSKLVSQGRQTDRGRHTASLSRVLRATV